VTEIMIEDFLKLRKKLFHDHRTPQGEGCCVVGGRFLNVMNISHKGASCSFLPRCVKILMTFQSPRRRRSAPREPGW
jgi:hypothetical protein